MLKQIMNYLLGRTNIKSLQKRGESKLKVFTKTIDELDLINAELEVISLYNSDKIKTLEKQNTEIIATQLHNSVVSNKLKSIFK